MLGLYVFLTLALTALTLFNQFSVRGWQHFPDEALVAIPVTLLISAAIIAVPFGLVLLFRKLTGKS